jgi:hypothetical protein
MQRGTMLRGAGRSVHGFIGLLRGIGLSGRLLHGGDELRRERPELLYRRIVPRGVRLQWFELCRVRRWRTAVLHGRCVQRRSGLHERHLQSTTAVRQRRADVLRARVQPGARVQQRHVPDAGCVRDDGAGVLHRRYVHGNAGLHERNVSAATAELWKRGAAVLHREYVYGRVELRHGHVFDLPCRRHDVHRRE